MGVAYDLLRGPCAVYADFKSRPPNSSFLQHRRTPPFGTVFRELSANNSLHIYRSAKPKGDIYFPFIILYYEIALWARTCTESFLLAILQK